MKLLTILHILGSVVHLVLATDTAEYTCTAAGNLNILNIHFTSIPQARVFAQHKETSCTSDTITQISPTVIIGGSSASGFSGTIDAINNRDECGVTESNTKFTYVIIVAQNLDVVVSTDIKLTFICDTANPNEAQIQTASTSTVTSGPQDGTTTKKVPVVLTAVIASGGSAAASAVLGTPIKLKMTLTLVTNGVQKCQVVSCDASATSAFTKFVSIVGDNGCSVKKSGLFDDTTGKFTKSSSSTSTVVIYELTAFKIFKFSGQSGVFFRCKCKGCTENTDTACPEASCSGGGRRRRQIFTERVTDSNATTFIQVYDHLQQLGSVGAAGRQSSGIADCMNHVSLLTVVVTLAVLLCASFIVSLYLCSKLIGRKRDRIDEAAYENPSYKS